MFGLFGKQLRLHFIQFFEDRFAFFDGRTRFVECGTDKEVRQRHVSFFCAQEEQFTLFFGDAQSDRQISFVVFCHVFTAQVHFVICFSPLFSK